jgi:hypothetical protein
MGNVNEPRRSQAAVRKLEERQAAYREELGGSRDDVDYPNKIPEMAELDVSHEFFGRRVMSGLSDPRANQIDYEIRLLGNPRYRAAVNKRIAVLTRKFEKGDGDIWSKYERLEHRSRLIDLVVRVEAAARKGGYNLPRRPVVGTLPTRDIQARAIPGPLGEGDIVAFESGLFMFTAVMARIITLSLSIPGPLFRFVAVPTLIITRSLSILPAWVRPSLLYERQAIVRHIASHPDVLLDFADLIISQTFLGTCQYSDRRDLPYGFHLEKRRDRLLDAVDIFVLAHEYGHVIPGHPGVRDNTTETERYQQEFEADELGFRLTLSAIGDPKWAYAGVVLFLTGIAIVDLAAAVIKTGEPRVMASATHPSPPERLAKLSASLSKLVPSDVCKAANELADVVKWLLGDLWKWLQPAFVAAHQKGHTERVAIRVYTEKQSYLSWFLTNAFGADVSALASVTDENIMAVMEKLNANTLAALAAAYRRQHGLN